MERVEKKQVSNAEGKQLVANGALASSEDHGWDAEWSDDEKDNAPGDTKSSSQPTADDSGADDWGDWGDDDAPDESTDDHGEGKKEDEDDPAEAWGWGDDDANQDEAQKARAPHGSRDAATASSLRELTLRESYHISSMPEPVLSLVFAILEDGALLTQDGYNASPVVASAAGLFNLPTFALAMFRAVSPYYYSLDSGGNM